MLVAHSTSTAGHSTEILCEIQPSAQRVLKKHFPRIPLASDVRTLPELPKVDLVAAGFPCQDLSQAGRTAGITGSESSLIGEVFRLLGRKPRTAVGPKWLLIENVPFMLQLDRGKAMRYLVTELEQQGFTWAYRIVDTRAFGLPQRRRRVIMLASRTEDPRGILLNPDAGTREPELTNGAAFGFYWTEGLAAGDVLALLHRDPDQAPPCELQVRGYGNASVSDRLLQRIADWDAAGKPTGQDLRVKIYPMDADYAPSEREIVVPKRHTKMVLEWE